MGRMLLRGSVGGDGFGCRHSLLPSKPNERVRSKCNNAKCLQDLTTAYNCDLDCSDVVETPLSSTRRLVKR
jgi:hypothetical protein